MGWIMEGVSVCNYVQVSPDEVPGPGDEGPQQQATDFEYVSSSSTVCWAPADPK